MIEIDTTGVEWSDYPRSPINELPDSFDVCGEDEFTIIQRIGSNSLNGRVYEIERDSSSNMSQHRMALKILEDKGSECDIAASLGSLYPHHFPRVSSCDTCPHVILEEKDTFSMNEEDKFRKRYIIQNCGGSNRRKKELKIKMAKIFSTGEQLLSDFQDMGVEEELIENLRNYRGVQMKVMATELLSGDLLQYIESNMTSTETPRYIGEVFEALDVMVQEDLIHGDLHLGNVLLRKTSSGRCRALIHDFGESSKTETPKDHLEDIFFFLRALAKSLHKSYEDILISSNAIIASYKEEEVPMNKSELRSIIGKIRMAFVDLHNGM